MVLNSFGYYVGQLSLFSQHLESVYMFLDDGILGYEPLKLFQHHPAWGSSYLDVADMNGAFKALAADFDLDGDNDIAIIARFLDERANPRQNFLYLENRHTAASQEFEFAVSAMTALQASNFQTMDAGDLDGDGDLDIVLGSMMQIKPRRRASVEPLGVAFLINQTR